LHQLVGRVKVEYMEVKEMYENALDLESFLSSDVQLNEAWIERAKLELNEDPDKLDSELRDLRHFLESSDNFKHLPRDDIFLIKFLRANSHDMPQVEEMISRYCTARLNFKQNFERSLPSSSKDIFLHQIQTVLLHRDKQARRVFIFRVGKWNPTLVSREEVFSANYLCLELMAQEQKTQVSGIIAVVDMAGMSCCHWKQMSMDYIQSMVGMIQNSFPLRFREIHIINECRLFNMAFTLVKPFLTEKMKQRLRFHGTSLTSLHECVPAFILPQDLGGDIEELQSHQVVDTLEDMEEFFIQLQKLSSN